VDNALNSAEIRILGALIEKESTTPEYYPLSLNALVAACNQKTSRFPVTEYSDADVLSAIEGLRSRGFAGEITGVSRVAKYAQRFTEKLNLGRRETAIMCVLMLRGPQTVGEIKGRTERMYGFSDLEEVETVLRKLAPDGQAPLVRRLPASPGMKEPRYAQALGEEFETAPVANQTVAAPADRLTAIEAELSRLRTELETLRRRVDEVLS
jgi:uncharacterized protein